MLDNSYKYLSDETKAKIGNLEVVTPSLYESIFRTTADELKISIVDEEIKANETLDSKLEEITAIDNAASERVIQLDKSTKKAIQAINDKNEELLEETLSETQALRLEIERLKGSLYKDSLTKVYNRKWLNSELLEDDGTFTCDGTVFLIDMNYFKHVNDTYGHIAGDKVLTYVANHLQKLNANVIRYGGDEFMVVFQDMDISKTSQSVHINRELLLKKKLKFQDHKFNISYSYGGVTFHRGNSFTQIIEKADLLMYADKEKIKERVKAN